MKWISICISLILILFLTACSASSTTTDVDTHIQTEVELIELTLEELAFFDGKAGRKAYIAVDGFIYDVSNSSRWTNGEHNGMLAGRDLSSQIRSISPHGLSVLTNIPKIGILVTEGA
jgi:predicted heme/steroid binding protein